ncbi:glycosyltransferase [Solitalea canadensis DSM 3403]|uniref:Glycosyltransferase n=2 Tax=Solitalea canadensis TaxID=995 RepID=H8KSA2_SOLCM|nr:glycosyltransferase [Solitalea canadensis DSM 3403]
MKILHVITGMDPQLGGVCQAVRTTIKGLGKLGVHNEVVCLDAFDSQFIKEDSFIIHALGPSKSSWAYGPTFLNWMMAHASNFDKIIIHGLWQYPTYATIKAIKKLRKVKSLPKVFIMPHGMLDPYFQKASSRKLKAIRNWIYWRLIEKNTINNAQGLLFTCQEEMELARIPFHPYQPKREVIVGLGVEAPPIYTEEMKNAFLALCPSLQQHSYLLFLSRIHEKKGIDLLLSAYNKILIEYQQIGKRLPKLVIAGPGLETKFGQQMQEFVIQHRLQEDILFTGMLTGYAKWGAFYNCEAFVLPSHQENFGIAVVESLACSKPVLISNRVNIWKEIEANTAGFIGDDTLNGTIQLLKQWFLLSTEDKENMNLNALSVFKKHYAVESAARKFLGAIK